MVKLNMCQFPYIYFLAANMLLVPLYYRSHAICRIYISSMHSSHKLSYGMVFGHPCNNGECWRLLKDSAERPGSLHHRHWFCRLCYFPCLQYWQPDLLHQHSVPFDQESFHLGDDAWPSPYAPPAWLWALLHWLSELLRSGWTQQRIQVRSSWWSNCTSTKPW